MAEERVERRLAAIMAADVVGYSRLMEADEERTLGALRRHRREFFDPTVAKHGGRIFKVMGDGFLVEFGSVLNAARCAVEIQTGMHDRNASIPNDRQIKFRIGINVGDIIVEGDDFYGDGVNLASRLEALAGPGGIACSEVVRHQIGNKLEVEFIDQGEKTVKNLSQPVHVYFINSVVSQPSSAVAVSSLTKGDSDGRVSVAVLPFANMSSSSVDDYFADGLTEDLTVALTKFRFFKVSPRQIMSQYKNATANLQRVGRELGVQYLVGGAVRKGGNRIRVTAQLLESEKASQLWSERFDRELADIFVVQDEIVQAILAQLHFSLMDAADRNKRAALDITAYDHYMRARAAFRRDAIVEVRDHLLKAIEIDPNYPLALANLAYFWSEEIFMQVTGEPVQDLARKSNEYLERAIAANDGDPLVYCLIGNTLCALGRHAEALHQLERALALNPFDVGARMDLGMVTGVMGDYQKGLRIIDEVFRLEPHLPILLRYNSFWIKCAMGDAEGAERDLQDFDQPMAYHYLTLAICCAGVGAEDKARTFLDAFDRKRSPWFDIIGFCQWIRRFYGVEADRERVKRGALALGWKL